MWKKSLKVICFVALPTIAVAAGGLYTAQYALKRQHKALNTAAKSTQEEFFDELNLDNYPDATWRDTLPAANVSPILGSKCDSNEAGFQNVADVSSSQSEANSQQGLADVEALLAEVMPLQQSTAFEAPASAVVLVSGTEGPISAPLPFEIAQRVARSSTDPKPGVLAPAPNAAPIDQQAPSQLEQLIESEFPQATETEREVWKETLTDMPLRMARDLLRLKSRMMSSDKRPPGIVHLFEPNQGQQEPAYDNAGEAEVVEVEPQGVPPLGLDSPTGPPLGLEYSPMLAPNVERMNLVAQLQMSMQTIQSAQQIVLNNIANLHTPGYKRSEPAFADQRHAATVTIDTQGKPVAQSASLGQGVGLERSRLDVSQGRLMSTQRPFDLAIDGAGFFQVSNQNGGDTLYTRFGQFSINADGEVILHYAGEDYSIEPALTIPKETQNVMVSSNGLITALTANETAPIKVGAIQLATFSQPAELDLISGQLFAATKLSGAATIKQPLANGMGAIKQGMLEGSNVALEQELAALQRLQNHYQAMTQARSVMFPMTGESLPPFPMHVPPMHDEPSTPDGSVPMMPAQVPTFDEPQ